MSTNQKTRPAPFRVLFAVSALVACVAGCGRADPSAAPAPADEYDIVTKRQEEQLQGGAVPLTQAMAEYAAKPRSAFPALAPQPSEDESALAGWSFKGAAPVAAGDVTMPPECAGDANPMACWGQKLSNSKGCMACHAIDGVRQQPCPNWLGLFGTERLLVSGETVIADETYLATSISNSWDQVVQGYGKTMPPYNFPEQELEALVAYLVSLGDSG